MSSVFRLIARSLSLALLPSLLAAQTGTVAGRVTARAGGAPVAVAGAAVAVAIAADTLRATTDPDGRFVLERVPAGQRTLRVRQAGYRPLDQAVRVRAGDTVRVELLLQSEAQMLAPSRTEARPEDLERFETRPNVGSIVIGAAQMAGVPSVGEPDVIRVVQLLPGVTARNDFNTGLNVRGGEADQNLILLDGYPIYNPSHVGGVFSTFMDATVGGIELLSAAFPARYGGRLSSVLDVRSAEETEPGLNVTADISVLGASARAGGIFAGGKGSWSFAGRRTYADAVASTFSNNVFPYHFRDFHARATYTLPGNFRLSLTGYEGKDVLDLNLAEFESDTLPTRAGQGEWAFDWGNQVVGLTIAKDFGERVTFEQRVSTSTFRTRLDLGDGSFGQHNTIHDLRLAGTLGAHTSAHDVSLGYEVAGYRIDYTSASDETGTTDFDLEQTPKSVALWAGDLWRVSPRWLVEAGLRAEGVTGRDWAGLSPRASLKFFVTPSLALTLGAGHVTQWLHSTVGDGPMRFFDVWIASDSFTPVATAWHGVTGAEKRFGAAGSIKVEGYVKRYDRLMEANRSEDPRRRGDEFFTAQGVSYGVDLIARREPVRGFGGWIAYTYGLSRREADGARWAPGHDRRHDLDIVATWRRAKYQVGARFGYATGTPYTPIIGEIARRVYDPSRDHWGTGDPQLYVESIGGPKNSARFPAQQRLDLEASRDFRFFGATLSPYVSVVNAYNAKNVFVYLYEYSTDRPTRRAISQFPTLPSVGVRVAF